MFATMHPHWLPHRKRETHEEEAIKKLVRYQTFKPILLGSIIISTRRRFFFHIFGSSSEETEWNRVASRLCAWCRDMKRQNRRGKRPAESGSAAFVSDVRVWARRRGFLLRGSPSPPRLLGYHPAQGSRRCSFFFFVDAACTSRFPKIPELNTCARDELHAYSEAYERIGKHLAAQSSSLSTAELARFHTDPKRVFWVIFRRSCSATLACLPYQQLQK